MAEPTTLDFYAGVAARRQARRRLMSLGLDFTEDRGLLRSYFVVQGSAFDLACFRGLMDPAMRTR